MKQKLSLNSFTLKKIALLDILLRLSKVYGNQAVDKSTVRRCMVFLSSEDRDVGDRPSSGWPHTAVSSQNEERLDQFIRTNHQL
jgi:hypothetical protein